MVVVAVTQLYAPSILSTTHTHTRTPTICPPDVGNGQTAEEWYFWVSYRARGITLEALRRFLFLLKNLQLNLSLHFAALWCLFTKLQLNRQENFLPLCSQSVRQIPHIAQKDQRFGPSTFCSRVLSLHTAYNQKAPSSKLPSSGKLPQ